MSAWRRSLSSRSLVTVCLGIALVPFVARLSLLQTRAFDPDEFQHLHAAWLLRDGLVPFRDFFEHHMPGIQMLLAPLMSAYDIAGNADAAMASMFAARAAMLAFAGAALVLTWVLARQHATAGASSVALLIVGTSLVFLQRTLEIRPDTPGLALWTGFLVVLSAGAQRTGAGRARWWGGAGVVLGLALVMNQKLLLAGPGLALFVLLFVLRANRAPGADGDAPGSRVLAVAALAGGVLLPILALCGWFWQHGALDAFVRGAILDNIGWPREVSAGTTIRWLVQRDPLLSGLLGAGFTREALIWRRTGWPGDGLAACWLSGMSLAAFFFVTPTPFPQYTLVIFPIAAVFGGRLAWALAADVPAGRGTVPGGGVFEEATVLLLLAAGVVAAYGVAAPTFVHPLVYPSSAAVTLAAALFLARRARPHEALLVVALVAALYPLQQVRWMMGLSNDGQVRAMKAVHAATSPADAVLDGFSGLAWFRRQAGYHGFLHPGVRAFLTPRDVDGVVATVRDCAHRPAVVILDEHLWALAPAEIPAIVERAYVRSGVTDVWVRRRTDCP